MIQTIKIERTSERILFHNRTLMEVLILVLFCSCDPQNLGTSEVNSNVVLTNESELSHEDLPCFSQKASIVGLSETILEFTGNAKIHGSVVLLGESTLQLSGNATIVNEVHTSSSSQVTLNGNAKLGALVQDDLTTNESAVFEFSERIANLEPTQILDKISSSLHIIGSGGLNVIEIKNGIQLSGNDQIILDGKAEDQFIILIRSGGISLSGKSGIRTGDRASPRKVLFLIFGDSTVSIVGQSSVQGTLLSPHGQMTLSGNGTMEGAFVGHGHIQLSGNGLSVTPAAWCPQFDLPPQSSPIPSPAPSSPSPDPSSTSSPIPDPSSNPSPVPTCTGIACGVLGI